MIEILTHGTARPKRLRMLIELRDCMSLTCFIQHVRWHHTEVASDKLFLLMEMRMTVGNYMKFRLSEIKYQPMFTDIEMYSIISFPCRSHRNQHGLLKLRTNHEDFVLKTM